MDYTVNFVIPIERARGALAESLQKEFSNFKKIAQAAGYGVVGFFSYVFGIIWSEFTNDNGCTKTLSSIFEIINKNCWFVFFIIPVIIYFTYSYTIKNSQPPPGKTKTIKRTKLVILILTVCAVVIYEILTRSRYGGEIDIYLWIYKYSYFAIFYLSSRFYQESKHIDINKTRFSLFYPSILVISINVFFGAVLPYIYQKLWYFILGALLLVFYLLFIVFYNYLYSNKKIEESNKEQEEKYSESSKFIGANFVLFIIYLVISGIFELKLITVSNEVLVINHIVFLSIFVAMYLSIFEAWHFSKNYEKANKGKNDCEILRQKKWINRFLCFYPVIVFLLYPIQKFGETYLVTFCLGNSFAIWYWLFKKKKSLSIVRALLGIATLIFLIFDVSKNTHATFSLKEYAFWLAILLPFFVGLYGYVLKATSFKEYLSAGIIKRINEESEPKKILIFILSALVLVIIWNGISFAASKFEWITVKNIFNNTFEARIFYSIIACCLYIFMYSIMVLYLHFKHPRKEKIKANE